MHVQIDRTILPETVLYLVPTAESRVRKKHDMEFSLPDLGASHIYPDRAIQTVTFLFATVAASLLLWLGLRLRKRS